MVIDQRQILIPHEVILLDDREGGRLVDQKEEEEKEDSNDIIVIYICCHFFMCLWQNLLNLVTNSTISSKSQHMTSLRKLCEKNS